METPPFDSPAKPTQNLLETAPADAQADAPVENVPVENASFTSAPTENASSENASRIAPPPVQFQNVRVANTPAVSSNPAVTPNVDQFAAPDAALSASPTSVAAALENHATLFAESKPEPEPSSAFAAPRNAMHSAPSSFSPSTFAAPNVSPITTLPPQVSTLPRATTLPREVSPTLSAPQVLASKIEKSATRPVALGVLNSFLLGGVLACGLLGIGYLLGRGSEPRVLDVAQNTLVSAGENTVISAVKAVGPAVMNVDTTFGGATGSKEFLPNPGEMGKPQQGKGTGVVIDSKRGLMLTNAHVVAGAQKIQVTTRDGQKYEGRVLGFERQNDIAVVELNSRNLPAAKLAPLKNARDFQIGETAIAIGNPFAQANTVTVGVVSATGRTIPVPDNEHGGAFKLTDMIQTDAAINPGNSGGPLCNSKGEVIGINTAIYGIGTGLGFAIPINKARAVADRIIKKGRAPQLKKVGFEMRAITDATREELGLKDKNGALVQSVEPNSPPAKAGLLAGDIVQKIDGAATKNPDAISKAMSAKKSGTTARLEILRNGSKQTLTWKIGK